MTKIYDKVNISTVEIKGEGEKLKVESPYSPLFVKKARDLGGEWLSKYKAWYFNKKDIERVKEMCRDVYGTDGTPVKTVDIEVDLDTYFDNSNDIYIKGIQIARRPSRDASVILNNAIVKKGEFLNKGGSTSHPRVGWKKGTILEVRDIPKRLAKEIVEKNSDRYKIIKENNEINKKEHGWIVTLLNKDCTQIFYEYDNKEEMISELPDIQKQALDKEDIIIKEPGFGFTLDNFI